ncbi:hypothetical protein HGP17_25365 [Rhizobium sp. P38BS-XIX]|uniref:hypothetical protein n=1 Tax=Rhizobium sp. P38BS-XIX TaxID=2726740 RepID=UPI001456A77A|nr:hypothetical protein [Rhizobium sp. P38BS-XIX]NLS00168.1 hypothetical protein [Rhizobium sp. P38BS-XIX]
MPAMTAMVAAMTLNGANIGTVERLRAELKARFAERKIDIAEVCKGVLGSIGQVIPQK